MPHLDRKGRIWCAALDGMGIRHLEIPKHSVDDVWRSHWLKGWGNAHDREVSHVGLPGEIDHIAHEHDFAQEEIDADIGGHTQHLIAGCAEFDRVVHDEDRNSGGDDIT